MRKRGIAAAVAAAAVLGAGAVALTDTYAGRLLRLFGPDVEDYRHLPVRGIAAATVPSPLPVRPDRGWPKRIGLSWQGADLRDGAALDRFLAANGTTAFLVLVDGVVADERYYGGRRRESLFKSFSITKSVLSALFGIAQEEGLIAAGDPLGRYLTGLRPDLASLRLQHLLDNTACLAYRRGNLPWKQQPRMYYTTDVRAYVRAAARIEQRPGTCYAGEDLSPLLAGAALEQALRRRYPRATLSDYLSARLWRPMGASYPALITLDRAGDGMEKVESGLTARAVDLARFGQLYLEDGRGIVPSGWVRVSTTPPPSGSPNGFPHGFHRNFWWGRYQPGFKRSDFFANGHFGQRIYVSPDRRLVLVRLGERAGEVDWTRFLAVIAANWRGEEPER